MFIVFEGLDGSGKTTQAKRFFSYLSNQKKIKTLFTSEPRCGGFFDWSELVLDVIINKNVSPVSQILLINALRNEHLEKIIQPAINRGEIVICDRYLLSTIAYQGYGFGLGIEKILALHGTIYNAKMPDLVYFIDVPDLEIKNRIKSRGKQDNFDKMPDEIREKIKRGFMDNLHRFNAIEIDGSGSEDEVFDLILRDFLTRFEKNNAK